MSVTKQGGRAASTAIPLRETLGLCRSDLVVKGHLLLPYNSGTTEVLMHLILGVKSPSMRVAVSQKSCKVSVLCFQPQKGTLLGCS